MAKLPQENIKPFNDTSEKVFDYSKVKPFIGKSSPWREGHDRVTRSDIRHWCEMMRDENPLYTDGEYAQKSKYGGMIAPPTMAQVWSLEPMHAALRQFVNEIEPHPDDPHTQCMLECNQQGYSGVVATEQEQTYFNPIRPGDMISCQLTLHRVSTYDHFTRMGIGRYVDIKYTFKNQKDEVICEMIFRVLKYKPAQTTWRAYKG
jgi:acyl dehydratase